MSTFTRIPAQRPAVLSATRTRLAHTSPRRTAAEAACQSAAAIAAEIARDRRADHLTRHARVLTQALAAMGIGASPQEPERIPRQPLIAEGNVLSRRELQVLIGISQGKANARIGRELLISEDTVKTHTRRIYRKLHANDRAHAVSLALRTGLIT